MQEGFLSEKFLLFAMAALVFVSACLILWIRSIYKGPDTNERKKEGEKDPR